MKVIDKFNIYNGNKFDFQNMTIEEHSSINFVSRKTTRNGVVARVKKIENIEPYPKGAITVTLGGSYLLTAYVQQREFYTAQNIRVLIPKKNMTIEEKLFYCYAISLNRFKYQAFGREANKTFDDLEIPETVPEWVRNKKIYLDDFKGNNKKKSKVKLDNMKYFNLIDYFEMFAGKYYDKDLYKEGNTPLISASDLNNGIQEMISLEAKFPKNSLTIGKIGITTFYQPKDFLATSDVTVLVPKFKEFNVNVGLFLKTLIELEKYKWSYGRQIRLEDCKKLRIKLPSKDNKPDWKYMEQYMEQYSYINKCE